MKAGKVLAGMILLGALILGAGLAGCVLPPEEQNKDYPDYVAPPHVPSVVGAFHPFTADPSDTTDYNVIQSIPPNGAASINNNMAITFFFTDMIDKTTINDFGVRIYANKKPVYGTYTGTLTTKNNTVMSFVPYEPFPFGAFVEVAIIRSPLGLLDKGGNQIVSNYRTTFSAIAGVLPSADANLSLESDTTGYVCSGDCAVISTPFGGISATNGTKVAVITSANSPLVGTQASIKNTTSLISSGAITVPPGMTHLSFDYKFISAEFMEFIGSTFDDTFLTSIIGPNGYYADITDSVNLIGENTPGILFATAFPGMPDTGDSFAGETPWITETIDVSALGSPIYVTFIASDVGDTIYSSVVVLDNLRFSP